MPRAWATPTPCRIPQIGFEVKSPPIKMNPFSVTRKPYWWHITAFRGNASDCRRWPCHVFSQNVFSIWKQLLLKKGSVRLVRLHSILRHKVETILWIYLKACRKLGKGAGGRLQKDFQLVSPCLPEAQKVSVQYFVRTVRPNEAQVKWKALNNTRKTILSLKS